MTLSEWVQVEAAIAAAWPQARALDEAQVRVRHGFVGDLSLPAALAEVTRLARAGREFPPTPGQLVVSARQTTDGAVPSVAAVLGLLERAAGTFGRDRELEAVRWLAGESPFAARAAVELGWRQFCRENLYDPDVGGAVRQRIERSLQGTISCLDREIREDRLLPVVRDRLAALEAGRDRPRGLRAVGDVLGMLEAPHDADESGQVAA